MGLKLIKTFTGRRLENGEQKLHDLIARNQIKSFKSHACSKVIAKDNKTATIRANRDILGTLLSFCSNNNKRIDQETAYGKPRKTAKKQTARKFVEIR